MILKRIIKWTALLVLFLLVVGFLLGLVAYFKSSNDLPVLKSGGGEKMRAIVYTDYGSPDALKVESIQKPTPTDDEVLVRIRAVSVNPLDWHFIRGTPYIMRMQGGLRVPMSAKLGVDFAGTIEAVGKNVTQWKPGDEVFGGRDGAFAEYVTVRSDRALAAKPVNVSFEQAASVPIAGITALQGLRDEGKLQAGQKVLINGASGGVGTFAVQLAKLLGAQVTGVCSTRNVDLVRSLGADQVIDYTKEDFANGETKYDVFLDNVPNHPLRVCARLLQPTGHYIMVGGGSPNEQGILGPLVRPLKATVLSPFVKPTMGMMLANLNHKDLNYLSELMRDGKLSPVLDRTYKFAELPEAIRYLEGGHARGKIVVKVD